MESRTSPFLEQTERRLLGRRLCLSAGDRVARVCSPLAFSFSGVTARTAANQVQQFSLAHGSTQSQGVDTGKNRVPLGGCGYAPVVAHRMDAQSRPYGRRVISCKTSPPPLAGRRIVVLGHPGRCGPGQQFARMAMGGRLRCRCGPLFPHL